MKICIFVSGKVRTLFYKFHEVINLIKQKGDCEIDLFYSFWDSYDRVERINDIWHEKVIDYNFETISENNLNKYFLSCGVNKVHGEIENSEKMIEVMKSSPLRDNFLSSQYYKTHRVVNKYFDDCYDVYLKIRSDITISDFPNLKDLNSLRDSEIMLVNDYYWCNARYHGMQCNEMIWISSNKNCVKSNSLYLYQDLLSKQIPIHNQYGEFITGYYFNSLNQNIKSFNFKFKVYR